MFFFSFLSFARFHRFFFFLAVRLFFLNLSFIFSLSLSLFHLACHGKNTKKKNKTKKKKKNTNQSVRVVAYDARGHGETETDDDADLSASTQAEDAAALWRALFAAEIAAGRPPKTVAVGHAMGGMACVRAAAQCGGYGGVCGRNGTNGLFFFLFSHLGKKKLGLGLLLSFLSFFFCSLRKKKKT